MKIRRGDILYADLGVQYQGSIQEFPQQKDIRNNP